MPHHMYRNSKKKIRVYCTNLSILKLQICFWGQTPHNWENKVQMAKSRVPGLLSWRCFSSQIMPFWSLVLRMWLIWLLLHQIWVNLKWRKLITWMGHRFLEHHTESRACKSLSQEWEYLDQDTSLHMSQCMPLLPVVWSIYLQVC
jgi:hypothetical protein